MSRKYEKIHNKWTRSNFSKSNGLSILYELAYECTMRESVMALNFRDKIIQKISYYENNTNIEHKN